MIMAVQNILLYSPIGRSGGGYAVKRIEILGRPCLGAAPAHSHGESVLSRLRRGLPPDTPAQKPARTTSDSIAGPRVRTIAAALLPVPAKLLDPGSVRLPCISSSTGGKQSARERLDAMHARVKAKEMARQLSL